jgi:hypothetical protein
MNIAYLLYEAERPRSAAEQREADERAGELAAAVARLGRSLRHSPAAGRGHRGAGGGPACPPAGQLACLVPRQR